MIIITMHDNHNNKTNNKVYSCIIIIMINRYTIKTYLKNLLCKTDIDFSMSNVLTKVVTILVSFPDVN